MDADGALIGCKGSDPAWVEKFSVGAGGAPEQFWINLGSTPDSMVVGWLTADMTAGTNVQYGTSSGSYPNQASGNSTFYKYSAKYTSGLIHHVRLAGLAPSTTYFYRVGDSTAWSQEFSFKSSPGVGPIFPYTFGFIADIGENDNANDTVTHLLANPQIDSFVLNGDISYASGCEATGCATWDAFQRMMAPLTASKPMAINLGNHELYDNANGVLAISARTRFNGMPYPAGSKDDCFYFSYEVGPTHVISVSSFYPLGFGANSPLTVWLLNDLKTVDRTKTPWVIVSLHAPWYNSNTEHQGDGEPMRVGLEAMMISAGVNAIFCGHVHAYERSAPVNNKQVVPAGQGIVHFNVGDAGADLYTSWLSPIPAWSAYHSATFGHGEFQIANATHAQFTWHRNQDDEPVVTDSYWVINSQA